MSAPDFNVSGKHVLITGGRGGIGKAMGIAFRDAGAHVTLADLGDAPLEQDGMRNVTLDVRNDAACAALANNLGKLDVLIQCAGKLARIKEYEIDVFEDVVGTHLFGSFRLAVALRPLLAASKGCVINIGSMYSYFGSPHAPAYGAAKAALVQLTKSLAIAWAKDGIRVNCIAPGWVVTELTREPRIFRQGDIAPAKRPLGGAGGGRRAGGVPRFVGRLADQWRHARRRRGLQRSLSRQSPETGADLRRDGGAR